MFSIKTEWMINPNQAERRKENIQEIWFGVCRKKKVKKRK
jgi:hypothetical protein